MTAWLQTHLFHRTRWPVELLTAPSVMPGFHSDRRFTPRSGAFARFVRPRVCPALVAGSAKALLYAADET
jgi:hypothetical protein